MGSFLEMMVGGWEGSLPLNTSTNDATATNVVKSFCLADGVDHRL